MKKESDSVFRELKDDVISFAELKFELLKLNTYERIGKIVAILSVGLMLYSIVLITLLFVMITFGFLFGKWLNSTSAGFAIVLGIYLILAVIAYLNKDRIRLKVMNIIISTLVSSDKKKESTSDVEPEEADAQSGHSANP